MVGRSLAGGSSSSSRSTRKGVGSSLRGQAVAAPTSSGGGGAGKAGLSLAGKVLAPLDVGLRSVAAVVKELDDLIPGITEGDRKAARENKASLGDISKNYQARMHAGEMVNSGPMAYRRAMGLAGDLALDPLSYMTLGMAGVARKAATEGVKVGGRVTAKEVSRKLLDEGTEESITLANRIMGTGFRGSLNRLSKQEAADLGVKQGATIGFKGNRVSIPGGDVVSRAAAKASSPLTTRINKLPIHGIASGAKDITPANRLLVKDADRARRMAAKATRQTAARELSSILSEGVDTAALRNAMEGVEGTYDEATQAAAGRVRQVLDTAHQFASEALARDLPKVDNYLSHRKTAGAKEMESKVGGKQFKGKGGPGALKTRESGPGDIWYGEVLKDGSITERNRIFREKTGRNIDYWEDDPIKIAHQYVTDMTKMVERSEVAMTTYLGKQGAGRVQDVGQKTVRAKGAKAAEKNALDVEGRLAAAVRELEGTREGIASQSDKALKAFQRGNVDAEELKDIVAQADSMAHLPEFSSPGMLAQLDGAEAKLAALAGARGDTDALVELTGAQLLPNATKQGDRAYLMPDGRVVPETNLEAHAAANVQLEDLLARRRAMAEETTEKLKPQVAAAAPTADHAMVARDPEVMADVMDDNLLNLDALRAIPNPARQAELALREEAERLFRAATAARAAGNEHMAQVAALEATARKLEADIPNLDKKFERYLAKASETKTVDDISAMTRLNLIELANGQYGEEWVARAAADITEAVTPANMHKLKQHFDKWSGIWRATALLSPGFHVRNAYGAMFNNMLGRMDWDMYPRYWSAWGQYKKGGMEAISDPRMREAAEAALADGQWLPDTSRVTDEMAGLEGKKGRLANNVAFRTNMKVGAGVERHARVPLYIDSYLKAIDEGLAPAAARTRALDTTMTYHFDYDDLARGEREWGRRAFGFYTWARNNMPLMAAEMADKPGYMTRYAHLKRNMELGQEEDPQKPGYFNKALAIAMPFTFKGGQIYAFPDLPFISAAGNLGLNEVASGLNPIIKTPMESFTNTKFFEGRQMSSTLRESPAAWRPILEVLVRIPKGTPMVPRVERAKDGTILMDEREANKIESLMPLLGRMRRLAPSEQKYQDRVLTSWLGFMGINVRTLDESTKGGEMQRRKQKASEEAARNAKLEGGRTLAEFESAQRQAKAIRAAQEGR